MSTPRTITESVAQPFQGCRVDRDAGIIFGVRVCGLKSNNGPVYPWGSGLADPSIYDGRPVNAGHRRGNGDVPPESRFGWLTNPRFDAGGPRADLHVLMSHPLAAQVFEAAERNPTLFGLSHVAMARTKWTGGREVVESIDRIVSVDLVCDPATTKGLYESAHPSRGRRMSPKSVRDLVESLEPLFTGPQRKRVRKWLLEADEMPPADAAMMDAEVPAMEEVGAEGTDPNEQLVAGFKAAIDSLWEAYVADKDAGKFLKAIGKYIKAHAKLAGDTEDAADSPVEPDMDAPEPTEESTRRTAFAKGLREITEVFQRVGVKAPTPDQFAAVASVAKEFRESVARTFVGPQSAETPTSTSRTKLAPAAKPASGIPLDPADFVRFVTG